MSEVWVATRPGQLLMWMSRMGSSPSLRMFSRRDVPDESEGGLIPVAVGVERFHDLWRLAIPEEFDDERFSNRGAWRLACRYAQVLVKWLPSAPGPGLGLTVRPPLAAQLRAELTAEAIDPGAFQVASFRLPQAGT